MVHVEGGGSGRLLRIRAAEFQGRQRDHAADRHAQRARGIGEGRRIHAGRTTVHGDHARTSLRSNVRDGSHSGGS